MKKSLLIFSLASVFTMGGTVFAYASDTSILTCRQNGTTSVQSYMDDGLSFEEAKNAMLGVKFDKIDSAVQDGSITTTEGDQIKSRLEENSSNCTNPDENQDATNLRLNKVLKGNGTGNRNCNGCCNNSKDFCLN